MLESPTIAALEIILISQDSCPKRVKKDRSRVVSDSSLEIYSTTMIISPNHEENLIRN